MMGRREEEEEGELQEREGNTVSTESASAGGAATECGG